MGPIQNNKKTLIFDFLAEGEQNQCLLNIQDLQTLLSIWEASPVLPDGRVTFLQTLVKTFCIAEKISMHSPWNRCQSLLEQTLASLKSLLSHTMKSCDCVQMKKSRMQYSGKEAWEDYNKVIQSLKSPMWPTLGHLPSQSEHDRAYTQFLAQVLVCVAALKTEADRKLVQKALKGARDMAEDPKKHGLPLLPPKLMLPEDYRQSLSGLPRYRWLPYMERLLEDAMDFLGVDELELDNCETVDQPGDELEEEVLDQMKPEAMPEEDPDGDDFEVEALQHGDDCKPSESTTDRRKARQKRGDPGRAIAKANQCFPFSWNALSRGDLHILMKAFHVKTESQERVLPLALIQMMFWAGFNEERLAAIRLGDPECFEKSPTADWYDPHHEILYVFSPYPTLKYPPEGKWQFARPTNRMELRLPAVCRDILKTHVPTALFYSGERLFQLTSEKINDKCQDWLSELKQRSKQEFGQTPLMTLKRIQKYVAHSSSRLGAADSAMTNLILGREDRLGRTKVHYLSTDIERLDRHYRKVSLSMIDDAYLTAAGDRRHA